MLKQCKAPADPGQLLGRAARQQRQATGLEAVEAGCICVTVQISELFHKGGRRHEKVQNCQHICKGG
jgi:hypothetical protein